MSKNYVQPATDHVLIVEAPNETTLDGITLPDNIRQQEMISGIVVFVGPLVSGDTKPEDTVLFGPYAGKHVIIDGTQFRLMREGQIELYIRKSQS